MTAAGSEVVSKNSLLKRLYAGEVSLPAVFWGYWLALGVLTFALWCVLAAVPVMLFYEGLATVIEQSAHDLPPAFGEWRGWSRWIVLALVPLYAAPGYALFHSLLFVLPVERSAKQAPAGSFWSTRAGITLCLLPMLLVMLPGLLFLIMGFLLSFSGGLLSIGLKIVTFSLGLLPHGVLLLVLWLIRVEPDRR